MPAGEYEEAEGPIDQDRTLIDYDIPFAPSDPKKSLKLRQRLGFGPETRAVDPNARVVIDSFIPPRTWVENGTRWVQHASPFPAPRIMAVRTRQKLKQILAESGGVKFVGLCETRSVAYQECMKEIIRQVSAECWERGLLLLKVFNETCSAQEAHRELFESRTGYAFRLALKGEKDTAGLTATVAELKARAASLAKEEADLKTKCDRFAQEAEEQLLIDDKKRSDELTVLKKEANAKKNQLETLTAPIPRM